MTPKRRWLLAVAGVAGGLLVGATLALLLAPQRHSEVPVFADAPAPRSSPHVDALVVRAQRDAFVLRLRGGKQLRLAIRPADRPFLDVQHANSHAAFGQPARVYYCRYRGQTIAVYLEDAGLPLSTGKLDLQPCHDNGKVFDHLVPQPPISPATKTTATKTSAVTATSTTGAAK